jgi:hypothetical protein
MVPLLREWSLPKGALYFVTPTARSRPPKVEALGEFIARKLSERGCSWWATSTRIP